MEPFSILLKTADGNGREEREVSHIEINQRRQTYIIPGSWLQFHRYMCSVFFLSDVYFGFANNQKANTDGKTQTKNH